MNISGNSSIINQQPNREDETLQEFAYLGAGSWLRRLTTEKLKFDLRATRFCPSTQNKVKRKEAS